jgi:hypothetical protein
VTEELGLLQSNNEAPATPLTLAVQ